MRKKEIRKGKEIGIYKRNSESEREKEREKEIDR